MAHLGHIKEKVLSAEQLSQYVFMWRFKQLKIVFTNGCFDIIHRGHIEYLSKAKSLGDLLIVGLNTDYSVKRIKGPERPLQDEISRSLILASLKFVDFVILFNEDTPYELIKRIQPDILVKGGDYKSEDIVGHDIVKSKGGKVKTIEFLEGFSSTSLIEKLKSNHS